MSLRVDDDKHTISLLEEKCELQALIISKLEKKIILQEDALKSAFEVMEAYVELIKSKNIKL